MITPLLQIDITWCQREPSIAEREKNSFKCVVGGLPSALRDTHHQKGSDQLNNHLIKTKELDPWEVPQEDNDQLFIILV